MNQLISDKDYNCIERCLILSNGTKIYRHLCDECVDCNPNEYEKEYYTDSLGNKIPPPDLTDAKECKEGHSDCVKWSSLVTGIDNTGTRYDASYTFEVTLSNGIVFSVNQTPTAGWSAQLNQWVTIFGAEINPLYPSAIVEARCNTATGCGGLLPAPTDVNFNSMFWRYMQITACPTDAAPIKVEITASSIASHLGKVLAIEFFKTPEQRGYVCYDCGEEPVLHYRDGSIVDTADIPVCYFECAESLPELPQTSCQIDFEEEGCDNVNDTDALNWVSIYRRYVTCEGGETAIEYYIEDTTDPSAPVLVDYTLIGEFVDCESGEVIEIPCDKEIIAVEQKYDKISGEISVSNVFFHDKGTWLNTPTDATGSQSLANDLSSYPFDIYAYEFQSQTQVVLTSPITVTSPEEYTQFMISVGFIDQSGQILTASNWLIPSNQTLAFNSIFPDSNSGYPPVFEIEEVGEYQCIEIQEIKEKDCEGNETYRFVKEDGNGLLVEYLLQGELKNECLVVEDCGSFTNNCMCYGDNTASSSDYTYALETGDTTEGSFSMNTTTIKWQTSGVLETSIPYIDDCITNGGEATMTITDQDGNIVIFVANGFLNPAGTTPTTAYSGTGAGGFSGKIRSLVIACSSNEGGESGKACQWLSCDKLTEKWFDGTRELTAEEISTLVECVIPVAVEPTCEVETIQIVACSEEDVLGTVCPDISVLSQRVSIVPVGNSIEIGVVVAGVTTSQQFLNTGTAGTAALQADIVTWLETNFGGTWTFTLGADSFGNIGAVGFTATNGFNVLIESLYVDDAATTATPVSFTLNTNCVGGENTPVAIGDWILTVAKKDCEGVIIESAQYNITQGNLELTEPVATTSCDPEPDTETLENCFVDAKGVQWTRFIIFDEDTTVELFLDSNLVIGTPSGGSEEWTPCPNTSSLVETNKICFEFFGTQQKGYSFVYSDGEVQIGYYGDDPSRTIVGANIFCCDDCIQSFGCIDGRASWALGSEVVMANGDVLDISGLRYSEVANLITDTYGGTNITPSLGCPFAPNFSQCQSSSTHELQFYNLSVDIVSISELTDYGKFGSCTPKEDCLTECTSDMISGYDITDTLFRCSKIGFVIDNAFTSLCPDAWTPQDLVNKLNENNPTGTIFEVLSGNIIGVVSGEAPELIQFFHSDGGSTTVLPSISGDATLCAKRVKDCNSDKQTELLQEIADNTCPSSVSSNVVCSSTAQTVTLIDNTTVNLTAGQELLVGEVYDCKGNLQSFNISTLISSVLTEISSPVDTGSCPSSTETIPTGCIKDAKGQEWDSFQTVLNGTTITYYQDSITGVVGTPIGDSSEWTTCADAPPISVICKTACVKGVKVEVLIGVDSVGEYVWFKNLSNNTFIEEPDFTATCPDLTCETSTTTLCADGDYTGINDGDAIILVINNCSDGSSSITGATLLANPTVSLLPLPDGILFQNCNTSIETELVGCVVDEDGVKWNVILIDGSTVAYQNQADNSFGTPTGDTTECVPVNKIVSAIDGKHCIEVKDVTLKAFLFINDDGTVSAKEVGGETIYAQGEYTLVSCCPGERTETVHLAGTTVSRPTDTPNAGWSNEITTGTPAISGDFKLCFTPTAQSGNTPQMIGINSDPNTDASYTSLDNALYLYSANGLFRIYHYANGANQGQLTSTSWVGQEICFERIGSTLTATIGGSFLFSRSIGTGDVFLDDSQYFAAGFWGSGSITYSDFTLVTSSDDTTIRNEEECCCKRQEDKKEYVYVQDCWEEDADDTNTKKIVSVYEDNTFPMVLVGHLEEDKTTIANVIGWTKTESCNCK